MNRIKTFLKNQDQFGKLNFFEILNKSNPKVHILVNDNGEYFIYYESKKYGFITTYLIQITIEQLHLFQNENVNFNDVFLGKPLIN